ncbi:hypothetical protein HWV62_40583 [Athelia sp. TMB]|nr:hypothetical protein HWV62_40583 [Athelia sp. TMB]
MLPPSAPSSPMLVTPFTSSSPPGRTYFQHARRLSSQTAASDYSDLPEDISLAWGAAGHPIKALPHAWGAHGPAWAAELDEPTGTKSGYALADSSDEEEDEDGGVHSRFALSSERGRWKSSPLPMKTYSRAPPRASTSAAPPPDTTERRNIRKLGVYSDLLRASSPVAPARALRLSSPLPPSSPPMSPVSVAHALPEDDYTTEEDMLVDDDAEPPQQSSKTKISSLLNPMDSDEDEDEAGADDSALIPPIATLDFAAAFRPAKAKTASPPPAAPSCAGSMPTPEPTPAPPELAVEPVREATPLPESALESAAPPSPLHISAVSLPTPEPAEPEKAPPAAEKQPLADTSNMNALVMIRTPSSHVPPELAPAAGLAELTVDSEAPVVCPSSPLTECMDLADTRAPTPMILDAPLPVPVSVPAPAKQAPIKPAPKAKKDAHKTSKASSSSDERAVKNRKALEPKASSSNADAAPAPRPRTVSGKRKAKEEKEEAAVEADAPTRKRAKVPAKEREPAAGPSSGPSKSKRSRRPSHSEPKPTPTPQPTQLAPARVAELQGMVIEAFAVARASALPASALLASMAGSRPGLRAGAGDVEAALEAGLRACGMFGKVESSFRDDRDRDGARALEAKWFYVPERDADQERAGLIRSMMPRAAKRSETKKYKQYYFQPLDKISRWDPEDDL